MPKKADALESSVPMGSIVANHWGPLRYSIERAADALSISRSQLLKLIKTEEIKSYKDGPKRVFISATALQDYLTRVEQRSAAAGRPAT